MEPIRLAQVVSIDDSSQVSAARLAAQAMSQRVGLSVEETGKVELVAVELANNILQHASGIRTIYDGMQARITQPGRLLFSSDSVGESVQVVAIDQGPGIGDLQKALEDGFSTRSTPGKGLGAVTRLSRRAEVFSAVGEGTVVAACVGTLEGFDPRAAGGVGCHSSERVGALSTAIQGETVSGDDWVLVEGGGRCIYVVVDGLGHGLHASEAAAVATRFVVTAVRQDPAISLTRLLEQMHGLMRGTRGAAIAAVSVDAERRKVVCCGLGNVSCLLQFPDGRSQSMVSHNGTIGHQMRRVQEFEYGYDKGALLVMHSDGLATHWKMSQYPGLVGRWPATMAGVLYRDALRGRDDATVLVARLE